MKKLCIALIVAVIPGINVFGQFNLNNSTGLVTDEVRSVGKPVIAEQLSATDPGNGKYFSTQPGVKYVEISNCCEAGPIKYKMYNASGVFESQYKKSSYVSGLFFNPNNNDFLYIYKEKDVILDYTATLIDDGKVHKIKAMDFLSVDEKIKSLDRETYKDKIVEVMAEQLQKKRAAENAEQQKKIDARKAPVDKMANVDLTQKALACINNNAEKENYGYSFTKAYVVSEDWYIVKHEYSGAILKRTIEVAALHKKDGKCFLEYFSVGQDYTGSGFQKTLFFNGVMMGHDPGGDEIDCSKVK